MSTGDYAPSLIGLIRAFEHVSHNSIEQAGAGKVLAAIIEDERERQHTLHVLKRVLRRPDEERLLFGFLHGTDMVDFDVSI